jgi:uncharacterized protein YqeY
MITSEIIQKLDTDIKNAMKARETSRLELLRMVKTAVKNKEIELIRPLSEQEFFSVLSTLIKQRKDSVEQFAKAGRQDLADKEQLEIDMIGEYLPKALSDDELGAMITAAIQKTGASGAQDMGKIMKEIKEPTTGRVDGKLLADKVKEALQKLGQ